MLDGRPDLSPIDGCGPRYDGPDPASALLRTAEDRSEAANRFMFETGGEDQFVARGQATYVWTRKFGFDAPYTVNAW
jgi:hypothetical protein